MADIERCAGSTYGNSSTEITWQAKGSEVELPGTMGIGIGQGGPARSPNAQMLELAFHAPAGFISTKHRLFLMIAGF